MNLRTSIKPLTAAIASAIVVTALSSNVTAAITQSPAYKIKDAYIEQQANLMVEWLNQADAFALNPVNLRGGTHPDRDDPEGGPYGVVYIFPDEAAANRWWNPATESAPPQDGIPDEAVAMIHWVLDNGSGSFPGIMARSDVIGFKSRNCIMAAGDVIPVQGGETTEKTCSNDQGTSKRFKLNIFKPDVPVDLVYNVEPADLTYANYNPEDGLPTFNGVEEAGRIYRILQKFHNTSGMDAITRDGAVVERNGVRMAGFRLELGYGVGDAFEVIPDGYINDGLDPDKILGWELRPCLPDQFLDVSRDNPGSGANPCTELTDSTGQDIPQEIWLEEEYATFSPKNYGARNDKRLLGVDVPGGFWDKAGGGVYPPERQQLGRLDSGYKDASHDVYWDSRVDDPTGILRPAEGTYFGATVPNYWDIVTAQASNLPSETLDPLIPDPNRRVGVSADEYNPTNAPQPYPFGYLMHYGILADGDVEIAPFRVVSDDDGLPSTEGDMIAWWDGSDFRWSIDGPDFDGVVEPENAFSKVDPDLVKFWATKPLVEDCEADNSCPDGPLYEIGVIDDLVGLNVDSFVYLGRNFATEYNDPVDPKRNFTVRLTMVPVSSADPYGDGTAAPGFPLDVNHPEQLEDGAWVASPPPALETFIDDDGIVVISEPAYVNEPLEITVADAKVCAEQLPLTVDVKAVYPDTGVTDSETVTMTTDNNLAYLGTLTTKEVSPVANGTPGDGMLEVFVGTEVTAEYLDCFTGTEEDVTKTDTVVMQLPEGEEEPPLPLPGDDDDGGFCAYNPNGRFDPVLPALVLIGLGYLGLRRKGLTGK